ncbi:hypothetical protein [Novosphingobium sp. P6W]|nr:hypothetical protein [Novosphingobium sp. P6W]
MLDDALLPAFTDEASKTLHYAVETTQAETCQVLLRWHCLRHQVQRMAL